MKIPVILFFFCLLPILSAPAQPVHYREVEKLPLRQEFVTQRDWHVAAFQPEGISSPDDDSRIGETPAKLCFWYEEEKKFDLCTDSITAYANADTIYRHQTVTELSVLAEPHVIQFAAQFSGGGSGWLNQVSFWRFDRNRDTFQKAGQITLTEQGEYKWLEGGPQQRVLVAADAQWGDGETHFSTHKFHIQVYQFTARDGLKKTLNYITQSKYPGLDEVEEVDVISHETDEIMRRLQETK